MKLISKYGSFFVMACLAFLLPSQAAVNVNINFGATNWKYILGTQEASSPMDAWRATNFNDSAWNPATAPVGYAAPPNDPAGWEASIVTTIPSSGVGNYLTAYFRRPFVITNKNEIAQLNLSLRVDDGFVAWINGTSVGTNNAPAAPWPYNVGSATAITEGTEVTFTISPSVLVDGNNVLAVQVFQAGTNSSDLLMDATLSSTVDTQAPFVINTEPVQGATVRDLTFIGITFDDNVTGVNAADLLINNVAATNMTGISPREYIFTFPQPPTGVVNVAWASGHGITDLAATPNAFAGGNWTYTLHTNLGPGTVVISEFMADNENGIRDEDGTRSDWIEIYNPGPADMNLGGWFLTDTTNNPTVWRFPAITLGANKYLLVWASEKNRTNPLAPLHTTFRLNNDAGSYLSLLDPQTNVVSAFVSYPAQFNDISYGRDRVDPNLLGYFTTPTPGAENTLGGPGFAPEPGLSLESGVYTNSSLTLTITVPPGATVVYTLNGALPTNGSPVYSSPLTLATNVTVKVRALKAGLWPSPVLARTFVFLDATTRDFSSNLPILILSSEGRAIAGQVQPGAPRTKGTFVVFDTFRGRSSVRRKPDFQGPAEFEIFGQTSAGFAKMPYNIEIQDELGNDKAESILGMPAEADWKLRNPHSDKCLMNDFLAYELFDQMGNYSVRRKFVEVFVDSGGGRLTYPGDYVGVEVFLEKIERGDDRVNIARLNPGDTNEPAISGGYMFKRDKPSAGDLDFSTPIGTPFKLHEPKPREVNNSVNHPQVQWLRRYLGFYETAVNAANWTTATGTNHYSHYIDVDSFVDNHWVTEFPKQIDGYRISNFFAKDRNGRIKNIPIWDWNLSFGNANYLDGGHTNLWYYNQIGAGDHVWLRRLVGSAALPNSGGDPDFIQKIIDRWGVLRTNIMNGDRLVARIDEIATLLTEAAARNFTKYVYLNVNHWPNPDGLRNGDASIPTTSTQQRNWDVDYEQPTYAAIISEMKKWTSGRYNWIDSIFPLAPTFNQNGGTIQAGFSLAMAAPAGTIYYTLDGSDPRQAQANGAVAAGAQTYAGPITLNGNTRAFARARNGTVWSPPTIATFVVQTPKLVITEIMYHPQNPAIGSIYTDEDFEYIEVKNIGATPLNLNRFRISGGIDFDFPNISLGAGSNIVIVANQAAFQSRYGAAIPIAGVFSNRLDNAGERLILEGPMREPILDFSYDDDWYPITDGSGFSLVVVNENAPLQNWGQKTHWRASGSLNGSPGQNDPAPPAIQQVIISEALTHSDPPGPTNDVIELRNLSGAVVNIGGWFLSDDFNTPKKYRIPAGTTIAAGGFRTFSETDFNVSGGVNIPFSLSSLGDEVYLFAGDANTNLIGYFHGFEFGAQKNGVTFGRHVTSVGEEHFVSEVANTLGGANSGPLIGPVVINEFMYRPPDVLTNGAYWNNTEDEYIELYNRSASPVNLFDSSRPSNTWKLDKAVEFTFPTNTTIPAGEFLLVVNFDPVREPAQLTAFRSKYNIPGTIPILGPYGGNLSNGDEAIALYMPDNPVTSGPDFGTVPQVLVEEIRYADSSPWPPAADGVGASLHRRVASAYGNDPTNWVAATRTPGAASPSGGIAPEVTAHPTNKTAIAQNAASFSGAATGPNLTYQWRFNGENLIGQTNTTLTIPNAQPSHAGQYQFLVFNPAGSAASSNATLTVLVAANILQQPTNLTLRATNGPANYGQTFTNATFSVVASSSSSISYKWRRGGVEIPGATSSVLVISNVTLADEGFYDVVITDSVGPITSAAARLTVLISPLITQQPLGLTVAAGASVSFTASARGNPLPFGYRWRRNGILHTFISTNQTNSTLTLNNVSNLNAGAWTVVITNQATTTGVISTNAFLTVVTPPTNQTVPVGGTATFRVFATNAPGSFPAYQWRFNNVDISGATTNFYSVTNVQQSHVGTYSVVVTATNVPTPAPAAFSATLGLPGSFPFLSNPEVLADGAFRARFEEGAVGQTYVIERSADLATWVALTNLNYNGSPVSFVDPGSTNASATNRFYRAREAQ